MILLISVRASSWPLKGSICTKVLMSLIAYLAIQFMKSLT